jgi:hypothetical protein
MDGALAPSSAARPETHQAPAPVDAALAEAPLAFSVCTLVNDPAHYAAMRESFARHGFGPGTAEYLYLDNSAGPRWCAFRGIPRLLAAARGRHVILCHQDVRLEREGADVLAARLAELDRLDPDWAVAGNAGATPEGGLALRISDPHGEDQRRGELPARVVSLDENFLVLRRDAPVGLSADLVGFHLYGADLCLHARLAGRSAWVIDFHLRHLSPGRVDGGFVAAQARFEAKFAALLGRPWRIRTTCTELRLEAGRLGRWWAARRLRRRMRRLAG